MPLAALSLVRVAKTYRAGIAGCAANVTALRDVSLSLNPGELIAVEATRGAGKTTLLLCAAGMLRPDLGEVTWPALADPPERPTAVISYVGPRAPRYGFLTVRESLAYAATVRALHGPVTLRAEDRAIELSGLEMYATSRVALLPRLEQARLLVALALVAAPKLMLVDDVLQSVTPLAADAFGETLRRIAASGIAVLWAARNAGSTPATVHTLADGRLRARLKLERTVEPTTPPTTIAKTESAAADSTGTP
ncbi:MAG TPA: ATP-binding cassette domain-containing protein [Gemmatimonadaceae bacterium]|nr:ATP-binding cassette domain-containing protein [Gemmatimonadaceae bacterium]